MQPACSHFLTLLVVRPHLRLQNMTPPGFEVCLLLFRERRLDPALPLPLAFERRKLVVGEQPKIKLCAPETVRAGPECPELEKVSL